MPTPRPTLAPPEPAPATSNPVLQTEALTKSYGKPDQQKVVLGGIDLQIYPREFICIVGHSGAGKTTLLRCLTGLTTPTSGQVRFNGQIVTGPPERMAVVFQDYNRSLLPWMSVQDNVSFPLKGKGIPRAEQRDLTGHALDAVGLSQDLHKLPHELSGGMQQRVAIARALAYRPEVMIMDEPFASVDAQTRADLEDLTLALRSEYSATIVLVTHDVDEAAYLADRVVVLGGRPTRVRLIESTGLGTVRDQIDTKALPRFTQIRARVLREIRSSTGSTTRADDDQR